MDVTDTGRGARLAATVVWDDPRYPRDRIEFIYRDVGVDGIVTPGDALTAAVLFPAMAVGEDVTVDAPVSSKLLEGTTVVVKMWTKWMRHWYPARVEASSARSTGLGPTEVAACFSGGLDSYFTVLRPREEPITTLITMLGFTVYEDLLPHLDGVMPELSRAADLLAMKHLVVESNAFRFGSRYVPPTPKYGNVHHGAVLAAMVLGLGSMIRRCYIASSWNVTLVRPWGSHPLVDPLWSTETLGFIHDGAEFSRSGKYRSVANSQVVLDTLRVCTRRRSFPENCRECDKCQSTALMLLLAGTLDRCGTLGPVTPETIRRTVIGPSYVHMFEELREQTDDLAITRAITSALRKARLRRAARPIGNLLRRYGLR